MKTAILAAPATLAFLALSPLFATFVCAFTQVIPDVMRTEAFALLIFQGCLPTAAALFAVAMVSLIAQEI